MFEILILISLLWIVRVISTIIAREKKRIRAKKKLEMFERMSPPRGSKED